MDSDSDRLLPAPILADAIRIFGAALKANAWAHSPLPALGGKRPLDAVGTAEGRVRLRELLAAIEFGAFV